VTLVTVLQGITYLQDQISSVIRPFITTDNEGLKRLAMKLTFYMRDAFEEDESEDFHM